MSSSRSSSGRPVRPTARASPVPRCTACSTNSRRRPALSSVSFLVTRSAPWPDHDDRPVDLGRRERVEHVEHHGPAAEQVQRLRAGRPHARALAGGQHHRGQVSLGHGDRSTAPHACALPRLCDHARIARALTGQAKPSASTSPSTTCTKNRAVDAVGGAVSISTTSPVSSSTRHGAVAVAARPNTTVWSPMVASCGVSGAGAGELLAVLVQERAGCRPRRPARRRPARRRRRSCPRRG